MLDHVPQRRSREEARVTLRAPFPWFGGKRRVAHVVWERFGEVPNYVEPFAGSLAVLLARPHAARAETINDLDCYVANFWRALAQDPEGIAAHVDWPVNEADLHARHQWLVDQASFRERMKLDPFFYDVRIAGWWVWGISQWIGSGWCVRPEWQGRFNGVHAKGVHAKRPRLGRGGRGVTRQLPCLHGDAGAYGRGVHASAKLEDEGSVSEWIRALAARIRRVRVCCGDWSRILGDSPTVCIGTTAVFLDPPYGERASTDARLLYAEDSLSVAAMVRAWALEHGDDPRLRIALCGYEGEHVMPATWSCFAWKAAGGYSKAGVDGRRLADRERIWFSPHCLAPAAANSAQQTIEGVA
jgi:DNA adenine methylase